MVSSILSMVFLCSFWLSLALFCKTITVSSRRFIASIRLFWFSLRILFSFSILFWFSRRILSLIASKFTCREWNCLRTSAFLRAFLGGSFQVPVRCAKKFVTEVLWAWLGFLSSDARVTWEKQPNWFGTNSNKTIWIPGFVIKSLGTREVWPFSSVAN